MSHDTQGRAYLKQSEAKAGQMIEVDGGFTCIDEGKVAVLYGNDDPYFMCKEGRHYLSGQLATDEDGGDFYVGLYPA